MNIRLEKGQYPIGTDQARAAIREGEERLKCSGRVLVRASGTERLIRVMAEGDEDKLVAKVVETIAQTVKRSPTKLVSLCHQAAARPFLTCGFRSKKSVTARSFA